jgi:hypothetical protein
MPLKKTTTAIEIKNKIFGDVATRSPIISRMLLVGLS